MLLNSIQLICSGLHIEGEIAHLEIGPVSWQQNSSDLTGSTRESHRFWMVNHMPARSSELQAYKCYHSISDFLGSTEVSLTCPRQRIIGFSGWFWKTKTYFPSPHSYKGNWKYQIWKHQSSWNARLRIHRAKKPHDMTSVNFYSLLSEEKMSVIRCLCWGEGRRYLMKIMML